jgi:hypothetical protein
MTIWRDNHFINPKVRKVGTSLGPQFWLHHVTYLDQSRAINIWWIIRVGRWYQLGATRLVGYKIILSNKRKWNNCFIKNTTKTEKTKIKIKTPEKITRTLAILEEHGNCSFTMMVKPMKTLELHYPMIQFLINLYSIWWACKANRSC